MLEIDERCVEEGEGDPEAGAGANDVERLTPPVHELNLPPEQALDRLAADDSAMADEIQHVGVHGRMLGQGQVFWRGQSVTAVRPLKNTHKHREGSLFQPCAASS